MPTLTLNTYPAWQTITFSVASLASSSSLLAGRASTSVSNATDLYVDAMVSGMVRLGATPSGTGELQLYVYADLDGTNFPDSITGIDAAKTISTLGAKTSGFRLGWSQASENSANQIYAIAPFSIAQLFGQVPEKWGLFLTHSTGTPLHATAGSHAFAYRGYSLKW
jgi:hypothetical protein